MGQPAKKQPLVAAGFSVSQLYDYLLLLGIKGSDGKTLKKKPIVQGYSVIDTNDERVKDVAFFAATTVSEQIRNSTNNSLAEFRVVSAANQVATGFKMELEFQGDRRKTRLQPIKCKVIVFEWVNNSRKMTSCSCCKLTTTSTTTRLPSVTDEPLLNMTNSSMRYQQYDVFFFLMFISLMQYLLYNVF